MGAEVIPIPVGPDWQIAGSLRHNLPVYRFFPHHTRGEGFFLALMRKNKAPGGTERIKIKQKGGKQPVIVPEEVKRMISGPEEFSFFAGENPVAGDLSRTPPGKPVKTGSGHRTGKIQTDRSVFAIPEVHKNAYLSLSGCLDIVSAGIMLGGYKGKDFTPSASMALSTAINPNAFPSVELSYENAIKYLRKETLTFPQDIPKGYILLTYRHLPMGFAKNLGNRANNLYPQEWRIRSRTNPSF